MEKTIKLKKDNILRIGIQDADGNSTGEHLEFDLEDIELPFRINDCEKQHNLNVQQMRTKIAAIDKKQDKKVKNSMLSSNEIEKLNVLKEFYAKEEKALDLFLGEGGTKKLLNGRNPYLTMYDDIAEMLEPVIPMLQTKFENITGKIKEKYGKKEEDVL